jgi:hypothetical protein
MNPFSPIFFHVVSNICSDVVFALALTHHLILSQNYDIHAIFSTISMYSRKYVYIEFCPLGLWSNGKAPPFPDWYNEAW